jgi:ribosome-associated toxin RatA of RatAB toxin-antitoxin module/heme-degrading monooxygenase HmoA
MKTQEKALTLINVFPVEPGNQSQLIEILTRAAEGTMRYQPGFLSAHLYRGIEGTYVANCVQWRSREDFNTMWGKAEVQLHVAEIHTITKGNPQLYELCNTTMGADAGETLTAEHEIVIDRPWQQCFDLCSDLGLWAEFMPAVRDAKVVKQEGDDQEIELTADFRGQVLTWRSRRQILPDLKKIRFWNLTPRHPIKLFGGEWLFEPAGDRETRVRVEHKFELADPSQEAVVRAGISQNMVGDLKGMKKYMERAS